MSFFIAELAARRAREEDCGLHSDRPGPGGPERWESRLLCYWRLCCAWRCGFRTSSSRSGAGSGTDIPGLPGGNRGDTRTSGRMSDIGRLGLAPTTRVGVVTDP